MKKTAGLFLFISIVVGVYFFVFHKSAVAPRIDAPKAETPQTTKKTTAQNFSISGVSLKIETADTNAERILGLSGRQSLAPDAGLFFIFEKSEKEGIWMKDMFFPIDIIWIGEDLRVVDIKSGATPESFPEIFIPKQPALYVLEVNAGFVEKNKINIGDIVVI